MRLTSLGALPIVKKSIARLQIHSPLDKSPSVHMFPIAATV